MPRAKTKPEAPSFLPPRSAANEDRDISEPVQRIVPAASAPSPRTTGVPSAFGQIPKAETAARSLTAYVQSKKLGQCTLRKLVDDSGRVREGIRGVWRLK